MVARVFREGRAIFIYFYTGEGKRGTGSWNYEIVLNVPLQYACMTKIERAEWGKLGMVRYNSKPELKVILRQNAKKILKEYMFSWYRRFVGAKYIDKIDKRLKYGELDL